MGLSLGLAHFLVLGHSGKAWPIIADCPSTTADQCSSPSLDDCSPPGPGYPYFQDYCDTTSAERGLDACGSGANDSQDACFSAGTPAEFDDYCESGVSTPDNPDYCPPGSPDPPDTCVYTQEGSDV